MDTAKKRIRAGNGGPKIPKSSLVSLAPASDRVPPEKKPNRNGPESNWVHIKTTGETPSTNEGASNPAGQRLYPIFQSSNSRPIVVGNREDFTSETSIDPRGIVVGNQENLTSETSVDPLSRRIVVGNQQGGSSLSTMRNDSRYVSDPPPIPVDLAASSNQGYETTRRVVTNIPGMENVDGTYVAKNVPFDSPMSTDPNGNPAYTSTAYTPEVIQTQSSTSSDYQTRLNNEYPILPDDEISAYTVEIKPTSSLIPTSESSSLSYTTNRDTNEKMNAVDSTEGRFESTRANEMGPIDKMAGDLNAYQTNRDMRQGEIETCNWTLDPSDHQPNDSPFIRFLNLMMGVNFLRLEDAFNDEKRPPKIEDSWRAYEPYLRPVVIAAVSSLETFTDNRVKNVSMDDIVFNVCEPAALLAGRIMASNIMTVSTTNPTKNNIIHNKWYAEISAKEYDAAIRKSKLKPSPYPPDRGDPYRDFLIIAMGICSRTYLDAFRNYKPRPNEITDWNSTIIHLASDVDAGMQSVMKFVKTYRPKMTEDHIILTTKLARPCSRLLGAFICMIEGHNVRNGSSKASSLEITWRLRDSLDAVRELLLK